MKNGKGLPSQFTTDHGEISFISVLFFGLTMSVILYQLSFYRKWLKSIDHTAELRERIDVLEKQIHQHNSSMF